MEMEKKTYCRTCLETSGENLKNFDEFWGTGLTFLDLYEYLLGTKKGREENSSYLCKMCEERLVEAYLFKEQCLESEKIFYQKEINQELLEEKHSTDEMVIEDNTPSEYINIENVEIVNVNCNTNSSVELAAIMESDESQNPISRHDDSSGEKVTLKYSCLKCLIKFSSYQEYQSHYREHHRKKKHVCSECGKLVARHNLEKHQLSHSRPEHVCEACGRAFTLRENLTKHIRIHMLDHRYECEYCGKKFIHWNSKRCHVVSQHTKEKKYECTFCSKKFAHSSNMLRHVRYHTGQMSHSCSYCSKEFNTTSELKNHIVTHTKEKNEICGVCNKAFGTRKGLRNHLKTHTGERDYVCPVCNKAFTQPHVLRTHLKSHPEYPMPPPGAILSRRRLEREIINETLQET